MTYPQLRLLRILRRPNTWLCGDVFRWWFYLDDGEHRMRCAELDGVRVAAPTVRVCLRNCWIAVDRSVPRPFTPAPIYTITASGEAALAAEERPQARKGA